MAQCRAEALAAGKAVMSAIIEEWPTARLMTTFGPSLSDNGTAAALNPPHYTFNWREHPVVGAFTAGLVAATVGTEARYIEGAEMYTMNTVNDITRMRAWLKEGMAAHSQFVVAANLSAVYSNCACERCTIPCSF